MAVFSVNQATQFYVNKDKPSVNTNGTDSYFIVGGEATDRIKAGAVLSYRINKVKELNVKAPVPTITVGTPVANAEYLIRLTISTDAGPQYAYIKSVAVKAKDNNATNVATQIKEALSKAAKRDVAGGYYDVTSEGATVTITPNVDFQVGKRFVVPVISVAVSVIKAPKDSNPSVEGWTVDPNNIVASEIAKTGLKKLHDLEYFCAGEKGDIYRGAAWPNDIPFVSKLAEATEDWYIHTIHYYEDLSNEAVQKSEKTMIIVTSVGDDLFTSEDVNPEYPTPQE